MTKPLSFSRFLSAMLLLCTIFLQSCTEEMPILKSTNASNASLGIVSAKSMINLNINTTASNISNVKPNNILFTSVTGGATFPLLKEYFLVGENGSKTNYVGYSVAFSTDTIGSKKV